MKDFSNFVREQGIIGLAVGFILGGAVSGLVSSLVEDIINPLIGIVLGEAESLTSFSLSIFGSEVMIGNFISTFIDFIVVATVVYVGVKKLGLDKLDKKKEDKK